MISIAPVVLALAGLIAYLMATSCKCSEHDVREIWTALLDHDEELIKYERRRILQEERINELRKQMQ